MNNIKYFNGLLQSYLPAAELGFKAIPDCPGLELLLTQCPNIVASIDQKQIDQLSDNPPYWILCWASGRALASAILNADVEIRDKVVVDFGAGSGVVGIAAKLAGARTVYACDIDDDCCRLIQLNAEHNAVHVEIVSSLQAIEESVDLVLAADVLYEKKNLVFLDWMLGICNQVVIADSRLKSMPDDRFVHYETVITQSFPDYGEAKENNEVKLYRSTGWGG